MSQSQEQSSEMTLGKPASEGECGDRHVILASKGLLVLGLLIYVTVQAAFLSGCLWTRDLPPEPDDSLAYLTKTAQMDECFFQDCEALKDLRAQMAFRGTDPAIVGHRTQIVGRVFQVYHPLFSAMILGVAKALSTDTITAYKLLWQISPLLMGLGTALWINALWGPAAAGIATAMLAFSIFPNTGLHYFVPANTALALALIVWAGILARKGDAPLTLVLGTLVLVSIHPIGRIYAVIGAVMAATVWGIPKKQTTWAGIIGCVLIVTAAFVASATVERPMLGFRPEPYGSGQGYISALGQSLVEIGIQFKRTEPALVRSPVVFFGAAVCGFLIMSAARQTMLLRVIAILSVFLATSLFYVLPRHPADLFMRMLPPMSALFFGGVGAATWFTFCQSRAVLRRYGLAKGDGQASRIALYWPIAAFTVLAAFTLHIVLSGVEGWVVLTQHMRDRQSIELSRSQPERLLSESVPQNKVLYESIIIMPFYFVNGAMSRGAVFYPAIRGTPVEGEWLNNPHLRYAALYNPTVATRRVEGFEEDEWWQARPSLRYSALDRQRPDRTLSVNARIPMARVTWAQIEPRDGRTVQSVEVFVDDLVADARVEVVPVDRSGTLAHHETVTAHVRAGRTGWVRMQLPDRDSLKGIRILGPQGRGAYSLGGVRFDGDRLRWPWNSKADMTVQPRAGDTAPVTVSFDPQKLLPPLLSNRKVSVLDDEGSSVLIRIDPP
ncbi:MAG: hypothetical protein RDU20_23115 [Desulfomonilaceae bacterium]|nr:hypothetical protein [Desulfomonilaceae bacterium]